jgi:hypothetical protein
LFTFGSNNILKKEHAALKKNVNNSQVKPEKKLINDKIISNVYFKALTVSTVCEDKYFEFNKKNG